MRDVCGALCARRLRVVRRLRAGEYVPLIQTNSLWPQWPASKGRHRSDAYAGDPLSNFQKQNLGHPLASVATPRRCAAARFGPGVAHAEVLPCVVPSPCDERLSTAALVSSPLAKAGLCVTEPSRREEERRWRRLGRVALCRGAILTWGGLWRWACSGHEHGARGCWGRYGLSINQSINGQRRGGERSEIGVRWFHNSTQSRSVGRSRVGGGVTPHNPLPFPSVASKGSNAQTHKEDVTTNEQTN